MPRLALRGTSMQNRAGLTGPFAGSAIRNRPDLHIRRCGVPPREQVEIFRPLNGLKSSPGTSIVPV
jgi:hypothetical protein